MQQTASLTAAIRTAGFRATQPRILFLKTLRDAKRPLSIAELYAKTGAFLDRVTLYRIALSFEKAGLITRVDLRAGKMLYEYGGEMHHHHVICTECGTFEDVKVCLPRVVTTSIAQKTLNFSNITSHSLEFFGVCDTCSA